MLSTLGLFVLQSRGEHLHGVKGLLLDQSRTTAEIRLNDGGELREGELTHLAFLFSKLF